MSQGCTIVTTAQRLSRGYDPKCSAERSEGSPALCYTCGMATKGGRVLPRGYVKATFEISESAKYVLEDMKRNLNRTGETGGVSEAALVEAMILSARKLGVDEDVLARVLRSRKTAQERPNRSRR
jgi:hypothetical protein